MKVIIATLTVQSAQRSVVFSERPSLSAAETLSHEAGRPPWHVLHFIHTQIILSKNNTYVRWTKLDIYLRFAVSQDQPVTQDFEL